VRRALAAAVPGLAAAAKAAIAARRLARLRARLARSAPGSVVAYSGLRIEHRSGLELYMQLKDILVRGIYRFRASRPDPLVIDGGANIGVSVLATKLEHPAARVVAYEPDAALAAVLDRNLQRNRISGVRVVRAAVSSRAGEVAFAVDGTVGGRMDAAATVRVPAIRLADDLVEPVDLLKLNIEGEELPVIQDLAASGKLGLVRQLVIEYHGWPHAEQRLGQLLSVLDGAGFRYLVHDFDEQTCPTTKPPFVPAGDAPWFCLVHGSREGL
jgi:FkbM family methyltransferase